MACYEHLKLRKRLKTLKEEIMISEIGNDFYYSSSLYKSHQDELHRLQEQLKLYKKKNLSTEHKN